MKTKKVRPRIMKKRREPREKEDLPQRAGVFDSRGGYAESFEDSRLPEKAVMGESCGDGKKRERPSEDPKPASEPPSIPLPPGPEFPEHGNPEVTEPEVEPAPSPESPPIAPPSSW